MDLRKFFALDIKNPHMRVFVPLGFVQGLIAYAIVQAAVPLDGWDKFSEQHGYFVMISWNALIWGGLAFFMCYRQGGERRAAIISGLFALSHCLLFWLVFPNPEALRKGTHYFPWYAASSVYGYIALPFMQIFTASGERRFPYPVLYNHAWNNGQIIATSYLLTGMFFAVLFLAAGLMNILKVHFFLDILEKRLFLIPAYFTVKAIGYAMAQENDGIVKALRRLCQGICSFLAPILAAFAIIFVTVLPFAGLELVWNTRAATPIFLGFAMTMVLFFNSIFQDGSTTHYFERINGKIQQVALILLPVFGVLALDSTWQRVHQDGLTDDRYYALLFGLIVTGYGAIYAKAALRPASSTVTIQYGNIAMAFVLMALAFVIHFPGVNALSMSAASQYNLVASGKVDPEKADLWYLKNKLGEPGERAFARLKEIKNHPKQEELTRAIKSAETQTSRYDRPSATATPYLELRAVQNYMIVKSKQEVPDEIINLMLKENRGEWLEECKKRGMDESACALLAVDLDHDGQDEFVWLHSNYSDYLAQLYVWDKTVQSWKTSPNKGRIAFRGTWHGRRKYIKQDLPVTVRTPIYGEILFGEDMTIGFAAEGVQPKPKKPSALNKPEME